MQSKTQEPLFILNRCGEKLAYRLSKGEMNQGEMNPGKNGETASAVVFLAGFCSDMQGTKAEFLSKTAQERGFTFLRFDYSAHGESEGAFHQGSIGKWTEDAQTVIEAVLPGQKVILIGSSMGGWIGLNLLGRLRNEISGFIGIAAAPDFTERLIIPGLNEAEQQALAEGGSVFLPNPYGAPTELKAAFFTEAKNNSVMEKELIFPCPVHLLQGTEDTEVPPETALALARHLSAPFTAVHLIKGAAHGLSRPEDLQFLEQTVLSFFPGYR